MPVSAGTLIQAEEEDLFGYYRLMNRIRQQINVTSHFIRSRLAKLVSAIAKNPAPK
jgi:hypothetical protein